MLPAAGLSIPAPPPPLRHGVWPVFLFVCFASLFRVTALIGVEGTYHCGFNFISVTADKVDLCAVTGTLLAVGGVFSLRVVEFISEATWLFQVGRLLSTNCISLIDIRLSGYLFHPALVISAFQAICPFPVSF